MKYPILLIHGMGFRDDGAVGYWGRIPALLRRNGFTVYYSGQDSNGSIESNSHIIAEKIDQIIKETGAEKVNIIAHSKGGLEARYAASSLGCSDRIASITTLATPHNGSKTVDKLMKFPDKLIRFGCSVTDLWFRVLGDDNPDTYSSICAFRTEDAHRFNQQNPDIPTIYYQSYAFVMKHAYSDMLMWFPNLVVKHFEGSNDGLLAPEAVKWGNFRGVFTGSGARGISHCDEVDMRRCRLNRRGAASGGVDDISELYLDIARQLEEMGF